MDPKDIQEMIAKLAAEEQSIIEAVKKADVRLTQIRAARAALTALENDEPVEFEGKLADACRAALKANAGRSLTPMQVRDEIKAMGYDLSKHTNIMASIHSVLKRLAESDDVKTKEAKDGTGTRYYWAPTMPIGRTIGDILLGGTATTFAPGLITDSTNYLKSLERLSKDGDFAKLSESLSKTIKELEKSGVIKKVEGNK